MYGAITGDVVGSIYEFHNIKTTEFPLFGKRTSFTDDTVMTVAVEEWLMSQERTADLDTQHLVEIMQVYGLQYPHRGYGGMFGRWLYGEMEAKPYHSFGNGAAMRASGAGWIADTMDETRRVARMTAEVTHNHPEGLKGAEATAATIFLARTGVTQDEIRKYVEYEFGYDLNRTCDEIRPTYEFNETCQGTVPEAIIAFLESTDFESAIRLAISLGGDSDTLACITGGIAEAYYHGVPETIMAELRTRLAPQLQEVVDKFYERVKTRR